MGAGPEASNTGYSYFPWSRIRFLILIKMAD